MIERIRYFLGVSIVIAVPLGTLYWLAIHLWARWWRRWGRVRTYFTVVPALAALGVVLFHLRWLLLGADLGTNWILIGIALVLCWPMIWLELHYWKQLDISILVGVPELSQQGKGRLLRDGTYGMIRHPRYLSAGIGFLAEVLIVNHLGLYVLILGAVPLVYLVLWLEERELVDRFGDDYRDYQRDVPRFIPRLRPRLRRGRGGQPRP